MNSRLLMGKSLVRGSNLATLSKSRVAIGLLERVDAVEKVLVIIAQHGRIVIPFCFDSFSGGGGS